MSDGPHKTLNMRPGWKRLVRRADKAANQQGEVAECVLPALSKDWIGETRAHYLQQVGQYLGCGSEPLLFAADPSEHARLRQGASSTFEALVADHAIDAVLAGKSGKEAFTLVVNNSLNEWSVRATLQVEEHYQRESNPGRARHVRGRIQSAISANAAGIQGLAQSIVNGTKLPTRVPSKRKGLEEGPRL